MTTFDCPVRYPWQSTADPVAHNRLGDPQIAPSAQSLQATEASEDSHSDFAGSFEIALVESGRQSRTCGKLRIVTGRSPDGTAYLRFVEAASGSQAVGEYAGSAWKPSLRPDAPEFGHGPVESAPIEVLDQAELVAVVADEGVPRERRGLAVLHAEIVPFAETAEGPLADALLTYAEGVCRERRVGDAVALGAALRKAVTVMSFDRLERVMAVHDLAPRRGRIADVVELEIAKSLAGRFARHPEEADLTDLPRLRSWLTQQAIAYLDKDGLKETRQAAIACQTVVCLMLCRGDIADPMIDAVWQQSERLEAEWFGAMVRARLAEAADQWERSGASAAQMRQLRGLLDDTSATA